MTWLLTSLRRFRIDRAPAVGLVLLVFATAFVFALAPLVLDRVADEALRGEVAAAPVAERNLQLAQVRRVEPDPRGPMYGVGLLSDRLEAQLSDGVRSLINDRTYLADTTRWSIDEPTPTTSFAILRFQPGAERRVRLVEGRLPTGTTSTLPPDPSAEPGTSGGLFTEVAISTASAAVLDVKLGETLKLSIDPTDRLNNGHRGSMAITIVGTYEVVDPDDQWFLGDDVLAQPTIRPISPDSSYYDVTMLASPDAYDAYLESTDDDTTAIQYLWRYFVDPSRLESERADQLLVDLRRAESVFPTSAAAQTSGGTTLRSGLLRIISAEQASWRSAQAVLTVAAVGPAFVALAALGLVAILATERRRPTLALWRGRGASVLQLGGAALVEGLLISVPAAVIALLVASWLVPTGPPIPATIAAAVVAVVTTCLVIWTARQPSGSRVRGVARPPTTRRLVLEALVVVLAIGGAILFRDRGIRGGSSTGELATADPFIAIAPALLGLAAALVAMRLQPYAMRAAARIAATRSDLVPVLGLRRATRAIGTGAMLLVLLVTAGIGAFSLAIVAHLDRAAEVASWQEIGAAYRLDRPNGNLPLRFDPTKLPGVSASAVGYQALSTVTETGREATLLAVDPAAFEAVVADTPAAVTFPPEMLAGVPTGDPLPILISSDQVDVRGGLAIGKTTRLSIAGRYVDVVVAGVRTSFPSLPAAAPFAVISRPQVEATRKLLSTTAYLRASLDDAQSLHAALSAPGLVLSSQAERSASLHDGPALAAVRAGVAVAALVAAAYAAIALAAALALAAAARAQEAALLRTLGVTNRQGVALLVVEHGPTILLAFVLGVALGLGVFVVLRPGLGLGAVVGTAVDVPPTIDLVGLLVVAAVLAVVSTAAFALAAILQRSVAPVAVARRGIE